MLDTLRIACRTLAKSPAFALTTVAALGLGIGANTAIFSVINQVLLNPAGISDAAGVVALRVKYDKLALRNIGVSAPDFGDVQKSKQVFASAAIFGEGDYNFTSSGIPERLQGTNVSVEFFDVFGAKPQIGRLFRAEEDQPNANHVVILSNAAWKRIYGQDSAVVGRVMELNQIPYRIVGVMGPEFRWPADVEVWIPLGLAPNAYSAQNRFNENYDAIARLHQGISFDAADAFVKLLSERVRNESTTAGGYARDAAWGMFLMPFTDFVAGNTKAPMLTLLGAVGFVLLVACSNVAGLMLARASKRKHDLSLRAALGAGSWSLIFPGFVEAFLLALAGGVIGLALGAVAVKAFTAFSPEITPVALHVRIDRTVLLFTFFASAGAALVAAVGPALQIARFEQLESLKDAGWRGTAGVRSQRLRAALVVGQVALALVLLAGAGLLLRSLSSLENVNPGFRADGVLTASVSLPRTQYSDPAKQIAFYRAALEKISALPSVSNAAAALPAPFVGLGGSASFNIEGRNSPPGDPGPHWDIAFVSPGYFDALKIPLRSGRAFTESDRPDTAPVAIIDETLARQYWPHEDAIGRHIRNGTKQAWATIVGVVGHTKQSDLAGDTEKGKYYYPLLQRPVPLATFAVRSQSDPARLEAGLREAIRAADPNLALARIKPLSELVAASLGRRRFVVWLLGVFAGIALIMAAIGLYGVISYSVEQRTRELGIRMALGAERVQVLGSVMREGLRLAGAGLILGALLSIAAGRVLSSQLFQVGSFDPVTLLLTAVVLISAAALACLIPALRATTVDPMSALRYE